MNPQEYPQPRAATPVYPRPIDDRMSKVATQPMLKEVVQGSRDVLVSANTVFPFTLFPDTITMDREQLTITNRSFFKVAEVVSIRIEDILNVIAQAGPVFGSLKISIRYYSADKPHQVNYLWRRDALKIKRIVQGYIIASQKGVDTSNWSSTELARKLDALGQSAPHEET